MSKRLIRAISSREEKGEWGEGVVEVEVEVEVEVWGDNRSNRAVGRVAEAEGWEEYP